MRSLRTLRSTMLLSALALGVAFALPASANSQDGAGNNGASAAIRDANGVLLGTVFLQPSGGKLVVAGRLSGLAPGFHGFHIHTTGACVAPFTTAGGHLNPGATSHGQHAGDLPVLLVASDGKTTSVTETSAVTLADIFDADGAAFIIHALPDNYANIPTRYSAAGVAGPDAATLATGDSGGRVACGVITHN